MDATTFATVEKILGYQFNNKSLLEEALTHCSSVGAVSYERLEFIGDPILSLAISNHLFMAYPTLDPGQLSLLRSSNVNTEKLARVAIRHKLHHFIRHNASSLIPNVQRFADAVAQEHHPVHYGVSVKAPKVLADIVESIAGAIYVDLNCDLRKLWVIIRVLLEPIVTPNDLEQSPQPVKKLFELCQKNSKQVDIKQWKDDDKAVVGVYVDGELVGSATSQQKDIARLEAAKVALHELSHLKSISANTNLSFYADEDGSLVIPSAKSKLYDICVVKKWLKPEYRIEKDSGPFHDRKFVCNVRVGNVEGILQMSGDEKSRVKDAENSAATLMILALKEKKILCVNEIR